MTKTLTVITAAGCDYFFYRQAFLSSLNDYRHRFGRHLMITVIALVIT